MAVYTEQLNWS